MRLLSGKSRLSGQRCGGGGRGCQGGGGGGGGGGCRLCWCSLFCWAFSETKRAGRGRRIGSGSSCVCGIPRICRRWRRRHPFGKALSFPLDLGKISRWQSWFRVGPLSLEVCGCGKDGCVHDERGMWFYSLVGRFRSVCLIVCPSVGLAVGLVGWLVGFFYGRRTKNLPDCLFCLHPSVRSISCKFCSSYSRLMCAKLRGKVGIKGYKQSHIYSISCFLVG